MGKIKDIFKSWQVIVLILFIVAAFVAINPRFGDRGIMIGSVDVESSAAKNGLEKSLVISEINGNRISTMNDFVQEASKITPGEIIKLKAGGTEYSFVSEEKHNETYLGFTVVDVPSSNLKKGLDLSGGVRVLLSPVGEITEQQLSDVIEITKKRLNVYGLSDIIVRQTKDLEGKTFILIELAGATVSDVEKLVATQGKFEAKIGNQSVFIGGKDITSVCRSAECSGIDPQGGCGQLEDGTWTCRFRFRVDLSVEAAKTHAEITKDLAIVTQNNERYLNESLDLYMDDELVDSLFISAGLRGSEETTITISGPGHGATKLDAMESALDNMRQLQTVLITGSLPVKLEIEKIDVVSPTLGNEFFRSALLTFLAIVAAVGVVIGIRYRQLKIAGLVMVVSLSEILIILGVAAVINYNLDLAALAGILAAMGTGVDSQVVITDEALSKDLEVFGGWKERIKAAFFIIMASYVTTVVALVPLWAIGAGLMRGFAIMTTIGITIGVFVTRPAYAKIMEILNK